MSLAGQRDRRIDLWRRSVAPDATSGQPKETFAFLRSAWAQYIPETLDERFQSDALHASRRQRWRIPYATDLVETDQVRYNNVIYKIIGIQMLGRKDLLEILTEVYL